ncbi:MAG: histidine phosphatase family protein [Polyangiaceae bacterium]
MRRLILVRHGQYDAATGQLTALGRRQAATLARALRGIELSAIHCSTMPRARETAAIVKKALRSKLRIRYSPMLREKLPTPVPGLTKRAQIPELKKNLLRMQRAHARLARPARGERSELIVAHGNLIRMFVCLSLKLKPVTWLKMSINNGSVTVLVIKDDASEYLGSFNDVGHLPLRLRTVT